jgi:hypothetical protein
MNISAYWLFKLNLNKMFSQNLMLFFKYLYMANHY